MAKQIGRQKVIRDILQTTILASRSFASGAPRSVQNSTAPTMHIVFYLRICAWTGRVGTEANPASREIIIQTVQRYRVAAKSVGGNLLRSRSHIYHRPAVVAGEWAGGASPIDWAVWYIGTSKLSETFVEETLHSSGRTTAGCPVTSGGCMYVCECVCVREWMEMERK